MDVFDLFFLLRSHYKTLITLFCLSIIVGFGWVFLTPKAYRVDAILQPMTQNEQQGQALNGLSGLAGFAGISVGQRVSAVDVALASLTSKDFTLRFIKRHNLSSAIFHEDWDAKLEEWRVADPPSLWDAYETFDRDIRTVLKKPETGLISISLTWRDPIQAQSWLSQMISEINNELRESELVEIDRSLSYLRDQIKTEENKEIREAAVRLMQNQMRKAVVVRSRVDYAFKVIDLPIAPPPDKYVEPRPILQIGLAIFLGLALGIIGIITKSLFSAKRISERTLEDA